jgi:hypothetical protein
MVALWATPAARGFFKGAILQSDPLVCVFLEQSVKLIPVLRTSSPCHYGGVDEVVVRYPGDREMYHPRLPTPASDRRNHCRSEPITRNSTIYHSWCTLR